MIENIGAFDPTLISQLGTPKIEAIKSIVSDAFHLSMRDLEDPQRLQQHVSFARQVAMYLCRKLTTSSFPTIGKAFRRDHSTVIHAYNLIARRIDEEPSFAAMVQRLGEQCQDDV